MTVVSKFATAAAMTGALTVAVADVTFAAPARPDTAAIKAAVPGAATNVRYRRHVTPRYWDYAPNGGDPYYSSYYNGSYWRGVQGVAPYGGYGYDPLRGTYWDDIAPY